MVPKTASPLTVRPREEDEYLTSERCWILESWNRPEDAAVSMARARVAPGIVTRWHWLDGIVERYYILAGHGRMEIDGMAASDVMPGDVVYIPAGRAQRIANTASEDLIFLAVCTPRFVPEAYRECAAADQSRRDWGAPLRRS